MFFPKTTPDDLRQSISITILTICGFFLPSLVGIGGIFSQSLIGLFAFVFLLLGSSFTLYSMIYQTKESVSEVITLPLKSIAVLIAIVIGGWVGLNILNLNRIGARIAIVVGVSLIEFVLIFNSTFYLGVLINYLLKRRHSRVANE